MRWKKSLDISRQRSTSSKNEENLLRKLWRKNPSNILSKTYLKLHLRLFRRKKLLQKNSMNESLLKNPLLVQKNLPSKRNILSNRHPFVLCSSVLPVNKLLLNGQGSVQVVMSGILFEKRKMIHVSEKKSYEKLEKLIRSEFHSKMDLYNSRV